MLKQYDLVQLIHASRLRDSLTGKVCMLRAGTVGTIVEIYKERGVLPAYEVEFIRASGSTVVATVEAEAVQKKLAAKALASVIDLTKPRKKRAAAAAKPKTRVKKSAAKLGRASRISRAAKA